MAKYVLVHGAWHTGELLEDTAAPIKSAGHKVFLPTIAGNRPVDSKSVGLEEAIQSIVDYDEDVFDSVMAVNAKGPFLGLKAVIPALNERGGGSVVITSSVAGVTGASLLSPYVMSKHAVVGLTKSAAKECAEMKIRVNSVNPSPVETQMMRVLEDGFSEITGEETSKGSLAEQIPLGRYAEADEIAKLMLFLSSDESEFITGSVHTIDGGFTA